MGWVGGEGSQCDTAKNGHVVTLAKRESVYLRPALLVIDSMSRRNLLSTDGKWIEIDMPLTVNSARQLKHAGMQGCLSPVIRAVSTNCNIYMYMEAAVRTRI